MKKTLNLFLLFFSISFGYAQEITSTLNIPLKSDRDVFQIADDNSKKVTLILSDYKSVNALLLDEKLQVIDSIKTERKESDYKNIIGYAKNENQVKIIWTNEYNKKLYALNFDFATKKTEGKIIEMPYDKERIIQKFHYNDKFYIVTVIKNTNELKFYIFDNTDVITEKKVNLDGFKFYLSDFKKSTLYGVLGENMMPFEPSFALQHIDAESPVSLTYASKKRKSYLNNGAFTITLDTNQAYTLLMAINLDTFTATEKIFKSNYLPSGDYTTPKSNSFLLDDKLFCVKNNDTQYVFTVKNMNDEILSESKIFSGHDITFQNPRSCCPINNSKDFSTQFIKNIDYLNCGVSAYKINGHYQLAIGGVYKESNHSGTVMMGAMFGIAGALLYSAFNSPTLNNFNSYENPLVVKIDSKFDVNGKHVEGVTADTAFDKIQKHLSENKLESPTLFKFNKDFYLGSYFKKTKEFKFLRFTE